MIANEYSETVPGPLWLYLSNFNVFILELCSAFLGMVNLLKKCSFRITTSICHLKWNLLTSSKWERTWWNQLPGVTDDVFLPSPQPRCRDPIASSCVLKFPLLRKGVWTCISHLPVDAPSYGEGDSLKACCWSYSTFCKPLGWLEQGLDTEALRA